MWLYDFFLISMLYTFFYLCFSVLSLHALHFLLSTCYILISLHVSAHARRDRSAYVFLLTCRMFLRADLCYCKDCTHFFPAKVTVLVARETESQGECVNLLTSKLFPSLHVPITVNIAHFSRQVSVQCKVNASCTSLSNYSFPSKWYKVWTLSSPRWCSFPTPASQHHLIPEAGGAPPQHQYKQEYAGTSNSKYENLSHFPSLYESVIALFLSSFIPAMV